MISMLPLHKGSARPLTPKVISAGTGVWRTARKSSAEQSFKIGGTLRYEHALGGVKTAVCPKCGYVDAREGAMFCYGCGVPLKQEEAKRVPPKTPQKQPGPAPIAPKPALLVGLIIVVLIVVFACALSGFLGSLLGGTVKIKVVYAGSWEGSIGDDAGQRSVQGSGTQSFDMKGGIVVAVIQKMDGGGGTLTVQILQGDNVVESQSTSATYGVVSVSHSF